MPFLVLRRQHGNNANGSYGELEQGSWEQKVPWSLLSSAGWPNLDISEASLSALPSIP